ncbi:MAG: response regulator [Gemmatimonadota bacterium]|jgi:C4-dicarboxylate-specific signal transduction histidine kinase
MNAAVWRRSSLRRRLRIAGLTGALGMAAVIAVILAANVTTSDRLTRATERFAQEQAIADRINQAVIRELVAATSLWSTNGPQAHRRLAAAGDEVYAQVRGYLVRNLTPEERLQVEAIKEDHARLEVAASRTANLIARGALDAAGDASEAMIEEASNLQDDLGRLLEMRRADLERLRGWQLAWLRRTYLAAGAVGVLFLVGILVLERFLRRRVMAPLSHLSEAARKIGEGELDVEVPEDYDAEFATLASAFNGMTAGIRAMTADLETRRTELAAALDQLELAQEGLLRSEKLSAMGQMTAGVAHELNNPLTAVLGYAELLDQELQDDDDAPVSRADSRTLLRPVVEEARRAHSLVRALLRFSRSSGADIGPVPLREAVDLAVDLRAFAFEQAGLHLVVGDLPDCHVLAEGQRLQEILLNVMNNALDAMRPRGSGTLTIDGWDDGYVAAVRLHDDGPGIAEPERVFEPLYTTKPPGEGTGLGLALVHRFMEEFGGRVRASNRSEGGAQFILSFRKVEGVPAVAETAEVPALDASAAPPRHRPPRILVVEDERHVRDLQKRILRRLRADVLVASNITEARAILDERPVDAVVSDVKMPGGSGLDLYNWVQQAHPDLAGHFLFVTGDTGDPEVVALAEASPELFVRKPFEIEEYLDRVTSILG